VVGRSIELDGEPHEILGVVPEEFVLPDLESVELWIPLWPERYENREWRGFYSYGRLAPDATIEQAQVEMDLIAAGHAETFPDTNAGWQVRVMPLKSWLVASVRGPMLVFLGGVGLLLLIACANVANLLLARSSDRTSEFAVRAALGAGVGRLVGLVLAESLVLALLGSALGLLLSFWLVDLVVALAPTDVPRIEQVRVSGGVALFSVTVALLTSLIYGAVPAWQVSRPNLIAALRSGRTGGASRSGGRVRQALVIMQVSLATVLLIGSGLLLHTFANYLDWKPGFSRDGLVTVSAFTSPATYPGPEAMRDFYRTAIDELQGIASVASAGGASAGPLFGGGDGEVEFQIEGAPPPADDLYPAAAWFDVSPTYFSTVGIALQRGRYFTEADDDPARAVVIINDSFAQRYFPGEDPIGRRLNLVKREVTLEIVGVVTDVDPFEPGASPQPELYWPLYQFLRWGVQYVVRTTGSPEQVIPAIRERLTGLDPDISLATPRTMREHIGAKLVTPRFNLLLLGLFALTALGITSLGVYGVVTFAVSRRTNEIGIRMALGASRRSVRSLILGEGLRLCIIGAVIGAVAAFNLTRVMGSLLADVRPADPLSYAGAGLLLIGLTTLACSIPARRASRIDPMYALRNE
jgi:predicted permease